MTRTAMPMQSPARTMPGPPRSLGHQALIASRWHASSATHGLADAQDQWAFCSISASPGARAFYDMRRAKGDSHHKALRALANRWTGILHGCLKTHTPYDEHTAWAHRPENDLKVEKLADAA